VAGELSVNLVKKIFKECRDLQHLRSGRTTAVFALKNEKKVLCVTHDKYKLKWLKQTQEIEIISKKAFKGIKFYMYKMNRLYNLSPDEKTYIHDFFLKYYNEFKKVDPLVKDLKHILIYADPYFRKIIKKILRIKQFKNYYLDLHSDQFTVDRKGNIVLLEFFHHYKSEQQAKKLDKITI
jgi:hypothetical protein